MILYNITFIVENGKENEFIEFIKREYIPHMKQGNILHSARLHRILSQVEDNEIRYALHFYCDSIKDLKFFLNTESKMINEKIVKIFKDKVIGFSTIMQEEII